MRVAASKMRAAFKVQTSGRKCPVPSANPATSPVASCVGVFETANAVPLVPSETTTSPGSAPTPIAAAALSPVPAAIGIPLSVFAAKVLGSTIRGKVIS